ncbi:MAG: type II toxin-antitoxin system VapB family antitoxin [Ignavibacteria bacterium]|nr:type II toxin-antitoxin system VapB family antitoxin [Ignavibacteria bacterium]
MQTIVDLDDKLVEQAMRFNDFASVSELLNNALQGNIVAIKREEGKYPVSPSLQVLLDIAEEQVVAGKVTPHTSAMEYLRGRYSDC